MSATAALAKTVSNIRLRRENQRLTAQAETLRNQVIELVNDLNYWRHQHGCGCNHPACTPCKDSTDTDQLLERALGNL